MGTYGYVAPEYVNSGMLNEKSDIYSFGVVLLECVTARDPVDYSKPEDEANLVMMVSNKRAEEDVNPSLLFKPPKRLVGLKCVHSDADKRPKISHVIQMLEGEKQSLHSPSRTTICSMPLFSVAIKLYIYNVIAPISIMTVGDALLHIKILQNPLPFIF